MFKWERVPRQGDHDAAFGGASGSEIEGALRHALRIARGLPDGGREIPKFRHDDPVRCPGVCAVVPVSCEKGFVLPRQDEFLCLLRHELLYNLRHAAAFILLLPG